MARSRTRRRILAAGLAAFGALALGACTDHPGEAAVVGSTSISDHHLNSLARSICAAQVRVQKVQNTPGDLATKSARQQALGLLVDSAVADQYGDAEDLHPNSRQVAAAVAQYDQLIDQIPASNRAVLRSTLRDYTAGQLVDVAAGEKALAGQGGSTPSQAQALQAGTAARQKWAASHLHVSIDPRYGSFSSGQLKFSDGSLSAPVSSSSVQGAKATPDPSWVSALPANQKCS